MNKNAETGTKGDAALRDKRERVMNRKRSWKLPAVLAGGAVAASAVIIWALTMPGTNGQTGMRQDFAPRNDQADRLARASTVTVEKGVVRISRASVSDSNAHFFIYPAAGKSIFFFAMRASDGSIRVAYDACVACNHAKRGYRQEGDHVVCNNCGMGFMPAEIGMLSGGCNPIPLKASADGAMIVIRTADLEAGAQYF
jgi:hypothetical protein